MITETYVSFETAKLLKELGFTWPHLVFKTANEVKIQNEGEVADKPTYLAAPITKEIGTAKASDGNPCYNVEGKVINPKYYNPKNPHYPRPSLSMAIDWLEQTHNIFIETTVKMFAHNSEAIKNFTSVAVHLSNCRKIRDTGVISLNKNECVEETLISCLLKLLK